MNKNISDLIFDFIRWYPKEVDKDIDIFFIVTKDGEKETMEISIAQRNKDETS